MQRRSKERNVTLLIVDDHPVVRTGLRTLLEQQPGLQVDGAVESGEDALAFLDGRHVDVVLLDLRMPHGGGLEVLPGILRRVSPPKVLVLSSYDLEEEVYRAAQSGAAGYLTKNSSGQEIAAAIFRVTSGKTYFSESIVERLAEREGRPALSPREQDVLLMVSKGLTNKEIAHTLQLSQFTVRNHIIRILEKLEVGSRTEAVAVAIQLGLVTIHS